MYPSSPSVVAEGLRKRYGETAALDGFDLQVEPGTVCGLLGPNGAGKTTAVRILTTLARPDSGRAEVAGFDVVRHPDRVRERIGLVGQHAAVDEILSGRQNMIMFGRLFHLSRREAGRRAEELLAWVGLADADGKPVRQYSGGMRRRLDLAASLILRPSVMFLDEPTSGLDPRGRAEVWTAVRSLVTTGTTVLLTTQYLEEADQLADQITVIDHGRVIAGGSPDALKARIGGDRIDVVVRDPDTLAPAADVLCRAAHTEATVDRERSRISVAAPRRAATLTDVVRALDAAGIAVADVALRRPTLDDVFLRLTTPRPTTSTGPRSNQEVPA